MITFGPPRRFVPVCHRTSLGFIGGPTSYLESTGDCPVIIDLRKENAMSEPTREQLIQQANLRADYNEEWERGKHWEDWQCRPWNSPNDWRETKCVPFSNAIGYEYRRTPNPPKPIVVSVDGVLGRDALLPNDRLTAKVLAMFHDARLINPANTYTGQRATLTLAIYPEGCEVLDTVAVPRAVVEELLECYKTNPYASLHGVRRYFVKLDEAVKGGGE